MQGTAEAAVTPRAPAPRAPRQPRARSRPCFMATVFNDSNVTRRYRRTYVSRSREDRLCPCAGLGVSKEPTAGVPPAKAVAVLGVNVSVLDPLADLLTRQLDPVAGVLRVLRPAGLRRPRRTHDHRVSPRPRWSSSRPRARWASGRGALRRGAAARGSPRRRADFLHRSLLGPGRRAQRPALGSPSSRGRLG